MKTNSLIILVLALVIAVAASVFLTRDDTSQGLIPQPLLGEFEEQLTSLQSLELRSHDQVVFSAEKVDDQWFATHLSTENRFPANFDSLSEFIGVANDAKLLEAKTQNVENYSRLGVEDLVTESAQSRLLTLQSQNANFEVLVGNTSSNGLGTFVRIPSSRQSWQLDRVLNLPIDQYSWLMNPVLNIALENVLRIEKRGELGWIIEKAEDTDYQLEGLQETENLIYPTVLANTVSSMLAIKFESAVPKTVAKLPVNVDSELLFTTDFGALSVRLFTMDDTHWVTYDFESQPWLENWAFVISSFSKGQLVKSRSDFVETIEPLDVSEQP